MYQLCTQSVIYKRRQTLARNFDRRLISCFESIFPFDFVDSKLSKFNKNRFSIRARRIGRFRFYKTNELIPWFGLNITHPSLPASTLPPVCGGAQGITRYYAITLHYIIVVM